MVISSKNQTILVVTDIHQDINRLEQILKKENYDIAICAGDWWDSYFHDTPNDVIKTTEFVKEFVFKDNCFTLGGNHDWHPLYTNKFTICSGNTEEKHKLINSILGKTKNIIRNQFLHYIFVDNLLITHAGIHPAHLPPRLNVENKEQLIGWLDEEVYKTKLHLESGLSYWTYRAGKARGGEQNFGGWCWLDWNKEFVPINGLNQICGHTFMRDLKIGNKDGNYCIDTNLMSYILIRNGKIEIKNYLDL